MYQNQLQSVIEGLLVKFKGYLYLFDLPSSFPRYPQLRAPALTLQFKMSYYYSDQNCLQTHNNNLKQEYISILSIILYLTSLFYDDIIIICICDREYVTHHINKWAAINGLHSTSM